MACVPPSQDAIIAGWFVESILIGCITRFLPRLSMYVEMPAEAVLSTSVDTAQRNGTPTKRLQTDFQF